MTGKLITYTQDDLSRMADKLLTLISSRDNVSKPMILRAFAQGIFGPKCDWGRVTGSQEAHLFSQRARAASETLPTFEDAPSFEPDAAAPSLLQYSMPWHLTEFCKSETGLCLLYTDSGSGLLTDLRAIAKDTGRNTILHHGVRTDGSMLDIKDGQPVFRNGFLPETTPGSITVYAGVERLSKMDFYSLLRAAVAAAGDGTPSKIILTCDLAADNIKDIVDAAAPLQQRIRQLISAGQQGIGPVEQPLIHLAREQILARARAKDTQGDLIDLALAPKINPQDFAAGAEQDLDEPDGSIVKITGQRIGDTIRVCLREEDNTDLLEPSRLEVTLTAKDVSLIETFLKRRIKTLTVKNLFFSRTDTGVSIAGEGANYLENFDRVDPGDILLALFPLLTQPVDYGALKYRQNQRLAAGGRS